MIVLFFQAPDRPFHRCPAAAMILMDGCGTLGLRAGAKFGIRRPRTAQDGFPFDVVTLTHLLGERIGCRQIVRHAQRDRETVLPRLAAFRIGSDTVAAAISL